MIYNITANMLLVLFVVSCACTPAAFGHGLGLDTIPSIVVNDQEISVTVEIPSYDDAASQRQVTITATDKQTGEGVDNVTYLIGLYREERLIFRNYFFADDGIVSVNVRSTDDPTVQIDGMQNPVLDAWYGTPERPLEITGPVFESSGLYTFEIEIRTINNPTNIVEDLGVYAADVTIIGVAEFIRPDKQDNDVRFTTKSYFDTIESFTYDPDNRTITFQMPFDWSQKRISHIPVIHTEIHFPKHLGEFMTPSYSGMVNGIELFKSSVSVDDYTLDSERIVHFVLLQDHLKYLKNNLDAPVPDQMTFTLQAHDEIDFPVSAWTRDESFKIDLFWDPLEISPQQQTKFIFTIRDGATGEPLRNSGFDLVMIQNGQEIYRESRNAQIGGDFVDYTFADDQTGPTIIRFENIRNTGQSTEFGIVVVPEFGLLGAVLVAAMTSVVLASKKFLHGY